MPNQNPTKQERQSTPKHLQIKEPSLWIQRFSGLVRPGGTILDVACGGGRNTRYFLNLNFKSVCVDQNTQALSDLSEREDIEIITADLEDGSPWPFEGRTFDAVITTNYLHRPLMKILVSSLNPGGVFLYETFANGNQDLRRPRNPDHLLKAGELLGYVQDSLHIVAYEHGLKENQPLPGVVQRICAVNSDRETPYYALNL